MDPLPGPAVPCSPPTARPWCCAVTALGEGASEDSVWQQANGADEALNKQMYWEDVSESSVVRLSEAAGGSCTLQLLSGLESACSVQQCSAVQRGWAAAQWGLSEAGHCEACCCCCCCRWLSNWSLYLSRANHQEKSNECDESWVLEVQTRVSYECYRQCLEGLKFGIELCLRQRSHIIIWSCCWQPLE